jgi:hypothetical protein
MNKIHVLKTWPAFYRAVVDGRKTFEIRLNDRGYKVGDVLVLAEFDPEKQILTMECFAVRITYMTDFVVGLHPGYVAMGITPYVG